VRADGAHVRRVSPESKVNRINLGKNLRFFGDGYQNSKVIGGRRYWRIPVMDGEFLCEETTGMVRASRGGNVLVCSRGGTAEALAHAKRRIAAMSKVRGTIMPFPAWSGALGFQKSVRIQGRLPLRPNDAYCPTLRGAVKSELSPDVGAVLENRDRRTYESDVRNAMRAGIAAACKVGSAGACLRISAGNYGGKLGQFHFRLHGNC